MILKIPKNILFLVVFALIFGAFVLADSVYISQQSPDINVSNTPYKEYTNTAPFSISIFNTTDLGFTYTSTNLTGNCSAIYYWNGTQIKLTLVNNTINQTIWVNSTGQIVNFTFGGNRDAASRPGYTGLWHNITYFCQNLTGYKWWFNSSLTENFTYFRIVDFTTYTTSFSELNVTNGSVWSSVPLKFNLSITAPALSCNLYYNTTKNITLLAMTNASGSRNYWTASITALNDTAYNDYIQILFGCTDVYGNKTWSNTTVPVDPTGWSNYIQYDTRVPVIRNVVFTAPYNTTGGNSVNISFDVTDNTTSTCKGQVIYGDSTRFNITGTLTNVTEVLNGTMNCTVIFSPTQTVPSFNQSGNITFFGVALDSSVNDAYSTTFREFQGYYLKKGWNYIIPFENVSTNDLAAWLPSSSGVTYVSVWNNTGKSFITHTVGATTNRFTLNSTTNATLLYLTSDAVLLRRYYGYPVGWGNITLYLNDTPTHTSWDLVGPLFRKSLNQTVWLINTTIAIHPTYAANTTLIQVSSYNPGLGKFCNLFKTYSSTSCYPYYTATNYTIPRGMAVWVLQNSTKTPNTLCRENQCYGDGA